MSARFLTSGTYGDIYNFPTLQYKNALKGTEGAVDEEEGIEEDVMEEVDGEGSEDFEEFIEDEEESEDDESEDDESEDDESEDEEEVEWLEEGDVDIEESDEDIEDTVGGIDDEDEDGVDIQPRGSDDSDEEAGRPKRKPSASVRRTGRRGRVELEYELEHETGQRQRTRRS